MNYLSELSELKNLIWAHMPTFSFIIILLLGIYIVIDHNLNRWCNNYFICTAVVIFIKYHNEKYVTLHIIIEDNNDITTLDMKEQDAFLLAKQDEIKLYG